VGAEPAGLKTRRLAVAILDRILVDGASLDEAIAATAGVERLAPRDRAFVMRLVLTCLRHKGEADAIVGSLLDKPLPRKSGRAPLLLLLGVTQLLWLDVPAHAAIDTAVELALSGSNARHFAGLVNAVLRRIAAQGKQALTGLDGPRLNTPDWLWQRWCTAYGEETARAIAAAHMGEPPLDLTVAGDTAPWAARLGGQLLPTGTIRLAEVPDAISALPGFDEGAWWVQDAAAALPARLFGALTGMTALDLCAAPGGKTLQLCAAGARVTAVDRSPTRLARLGDNLKRLRMQADVVVADALAYAPPHAFDAVLVDAPCSATGTIRRHPDLPNRRDAAQVAALAELQRRLLDRAAKFVKPGGRLVYCTCSLEPEEGERQATAFLAGHRGFALSPVVAEECGIAAHLIAGPGYLRTLPHMACGEARGMDGFFAARLMRSS
jgi:16S rRNA (cytosine967-C5)-methyltransferase